MNTLKSLILGDYSSEDNYNQYFDQLNQNVDAYKSLETLSIETDNINEIPRNVSKFKNLIELRISGSRFWNLTMERIPKSVKVLYLIHHSNLQANCLKGMDRLINLVELHLDFYPFGFSNL